MIMMEVRSVPTAGHRCEPPTADCPSALPLESPASSRLFPAQWLFGHVTATGTPVLMGEIGGDAACCNGQDYAWHQTMFNWLRTKHIGQFYFCLNANSDDTNGLLKVSRAPMPPSALLWSPSALHSDLPLLSLRHRRPASRTTGGRSMRESSICS